MKKPISLLLSTLLLVPNAGIQMHAEEPADLPVENTDDSEVPVSESEDTPSPEETVPETEEPAVDEDAPASEEAVPEQETAEENEPDAEETPADTETAPETDGPSAEAEEPSVQETKPEITEIEGETVTESAKPDVSIDNDELYNDYLNAVLYQDPNGSDADLMLYQDNTAVSVLDESNLKLYNGLREIMADIASGKQTNTKFAFDFAQYGVKNEWDKNDLGVEEIVGANGFTEDAKKAFQTSVSKTFNLGQIMNCLLQDCPYEMYWFDKTVGASYSYSYSARLDDNGEWIMYLKNFTVKFDVAPGFNADTTYLTVKSDGVAQAKSAAETANAIVDEFSGLRDYDKIVAYKNRIVDLTDYNYDAANKGNFSNYNSSNPWQLIWVFDNDPATKVVCEGYSKAFQYLCELSSFNSPDVYCYTVTGAMNGGGHMWNILTMDDGNNYLVDVTNSDTNSIGYDGSLFLKGAVSGSVENGYVMDCSQKINYGYDANTRAYNSHDVLNISDTDYNDVHVTENRIRFDWNYANSGFMPDITISEDGANSIPECTYQKTGYVFKGWNTDPDGKGASYKDGMSITGLIDTRSEDVTLYAQWEKDSAYRVRFDWNYGNAGSMPELTGYTHGELVLPENGFERTGYKFAGWMTEDGSKVYQPGDKLTEQSEDIMLLAKWEKSAKFYDYTISFDWNYANSGSMDVIHSSNDQDTVIPECGFTRNGYTFTTWNTEMDGSGKNYAPGDKFTADKDGTSIQLFAQWEKNPELHISFDWNYGNSGSMPVLTVVKGEQAVIPENGFAKTGYIFDGWNTEIDGSGADIASGCKDLYKLLNGKDTVLYAQWKKDNSYTVTFDWNYGNSGSMPAVTGFEHDGAVIPENQFVKNGYSFTGWNTAMDGSGIAFKPGDKMPEGKTSDTVLYAQWQKNN